jgi:hypothetical protein
MTAAANLTGDRSAMVCLADLAEEQGDDARADAWRWLADPPAGGWERRAWDVLPSAGAAWETDGVWVSRDVGAIRIATLSREYPICEWRHEGGWYDTGAAVPGPITDLNPWVREACLAACRLALAGVSS